MKSISICLLASLVSAQAFPQTTSVNAVKSELAVTDTAIKHEDRIYKKTPQGELSLHFSFPPDWKQSDKRPAIVFFFGGGWKRGSYMQFVAQSDYFASRGMVAASADYRIESLHHTTPDKCVEDGKSAVRWLRQHANELGIDADKVVTSGGSAGGHIAACAALIDAFDADTDDKSLSSKPNAMVLYNPALNIDELAEARKVSDAEKTIAKAITPLPFINASTPPAIMFFGTADMLKVGAVQYLAKAKLFGLRAELWTAADQPHSFYNRSPWSQLTVKKADEFLASLGYLKGKPTIMVPADAPALKQE